MEDYTPDEIYLLTESNKHKKYKGKKVRIKNNKGEFVDIGRQNNDIPDSGMIKVQPDDSSKLMLKVLVKIIILMFNMVNVIKNESTSTKVLIPY